MRIMTFLVLGGWLCLCPKGIAQKKQQTRLVQVSFAPGFGTNGMHPASYANYFSLNLTAGYSRANYLVELALLSNLNEEETRGLQLAGIVNLTGGNAFAGLSMKEQSSKVKEGFEANLSGVQLSGISNIVLNNVFGAQLTGGFNIAKGGLQGFQVGGLANVVNKYSFGLQLAGLFNVSYQSMDGVQASGLWNYTSGGLYGVQIAAVNKAKFIDGRNTYDFQGITGLQIGLFNQTDRMDGFQIGLINYARRMQGTMIGLINIFGNGKQAQTRDGTPIGLINIGSAGYASVYVSEWFLMNVELATGASKNMRITESNRNVYIQNALIYSNYSLAPSEEYNPWAIGYGFRKYYFNRSGTPGMNNYRFLSMGVDVMQVNEQKKKFSDQINLLVRPRLKAGTRLHPKLRSVYVFGALSWQVFISEQAEELSPKFLLMNTKFGSKPVTMWPGLSAGIHLQ